MPSSIPSPAFARSKSGFNTAGQRYAPFVPSEDDAWDESRILHLLRRTGHQVTREQIDELASLSPVEAVDRIVNQALSAPLPTPPSWRDDPPPDREAPLEEKQDFFDRNIEQSRRYQADWLAELFKGGLREQMALFWHNHFVTEYPVYHRSAWAYRYVDCLRRNSLGDFKVFVHEIGLSPAMLRYLDGFANSFGRPNENYARELLELFTTGLNNYTERDIKEIARALTGWRIGPIETYFDETRHDRGLKTIFGRVGPFGYDDVIDLVFLERRDEIARFISSKLYAFFVHPQVDDEVVDLMAADFTVNDFNLEVPVRTLLRSNAFFDRGVIGAQIKSPIDFYLGAVPRSGHRRRHVDCSQPRHLLVRSSAGWSFGARYPRSARCLGLAWSSRLDQQFVADRSLEHDLRVQPVARCRSNSGVDDRSCEPVHAGQGACDLYARPAGLG